MKNSKGKKFFISIIASVGLLFLTACDGVVLPPIDCEYSGYHLELNWTARPERSGEICSFSTLIVKRAYSPKIDSRYSDFSVETVLGAPVNVSSQSGAVLVCDGVDSNCNNFVYEIDTNIRSNGTLAYQFMIGFMDIMEIDLRENDIFQLTDIMLVMENFGPGNSCSLTADILFQCLELCDE